VSIAYQLWRAARRHVLLRLGLVQGSAFRERPRSQRRAPITYPPHPLEAEYRVLAAPVGADAATLRHCWRQQVRLHHPDRFTHDPQAYRYATERLRLINEAYRRINHRTS
jgi:DnaJ-domain-containing protein 1